MIKIEKKMFVDDYLDDLLNFALGLQKFIFNLTFQIPIKISFKIDNRKVVVTPMYSEAIYLGKNYHLFRFLYRCDRVDIV